eukprot:GFUD01042083.1.p1 GENE.GFUD01042083.1~~GFUD01042083.1.p1  ORF type:complete len:237 (-),score=85.14 GFUD01042083.1:206-811(-)
MQLGAKGEQLVENKKEEVMGRGKGKGELRCPIPECAEEFVRSVHLKRHLSSFHDIQSPLKLSDNDRVVADTKNEMSEGKGPAEINGDVSDIEDLVKVPPLIIKLVSPQVSTTTPLTDVTKYYITKTAHAKKKVVQDDQKINNLVDDSSAEGTDDESNKVEIIDKSTVNTKVLSIEEVPMGIIINETSEALSDSNDELNNYS